MTNISYIWGYYHMITNHTIYIHRETTSTVYFICKSRTNKTGSISRDTRSSRRQRPKKQKVNKVNAWKEFFRRNLLSMEFGRLLLNSLNRWHPWGHAQCPLNVSMMCFFCKITYKQY